MKKKMFLTGAAAFIAAGTMAVAPVSAAVTSGSDGNTDVTYTNTEAVSPNGVYGLVIPATMAFTSSTDAPTMDIELVGVNGYVLNDFNDALRVTLKASSANDMKLISAKDATKEVAYTMTFSATETAEKTIATADGTKTTPAEVATFSTATGKSKSTVTGHLVDPENATVKDTYSDVVTFSFTDNGTILK